MSATAGKRCLLKVSGAAVTFTDEACGTTDNQTYTISNAVKRVWDRTFTITVEDDGVATIEAYTVNRLRGTITFGTVDALRGPITVSGKYLPVAVALGARSYRVELARPALDDTDFDGAGSNGGFVTRTPGFGDVTGSIGRRYTASTYYSAALVAGVPVVIEFYLDRDNTRPKVVCWALLSKDAIQAAVDGLVESDLDFTGTTDADGRAASVI